MAVKLKISMEETQTCCQIHIIKIAFSLRFQKSYVSGFGVLLFGLAGKQEFCLAKTFEVSAFSFTAHYKKPRTSHQTMAIKKQRKLEALAPTVPDKGTCWTASIWPVGDILPDFGQIFHMYSGYCSQHNYTKCAFLQNICCQGRQILQNKRCLSKKKKKLQKCSKIQLQLCYQKVLISSMTTFY